jgi:hypothetical protein
MLIESESLAGGAERRQQLHVIPSGLTRRCSAGRVSSTLGRCPQGRGHKRAYRDRRQALNPYINHRQIDIQAVVPHASRPGLLPVV